ncbi:RDD family protein [Janthinobacterium sp. NFX145]|uniref:RDD family protein n=1 Tax=Janthinobacterium sp. NFX145 TaxID=3415602 RepID=UPI003CC68C1A
MDAPDYSKYTQAQLRQVLMRIDVTRYPERVREVEARLAALAAGAASEPVEAASGPAPVIAPLWRRAVAFGIDMLILGLVGMAAGALLEAQFAALGAWGRLLGFVVTVLYFGVTQSSVGGGQSPGMRMLGLRVVTRGGDMPGVPAAFLRASIFCLAHFLNGAAIDLGPGLVWLNMVVYILIGALLFGIFYLLLFNRRTGQSLHDLATGALVVKAGPGQVELTLSPTWRGHAAVAAVALAVLCGAGTLLSERLLPGVTLAPLIALQQSLAAMPGIDRTSVALGKYASSAQPEPMRRLDIGAFLATPSSDAPALARRVAQTAMQQYPEAASQDVIVVTLTTGYDIGIASSWRTTHFAHTPEQWRVMLASEGLDDAGGGHKTVQ